MNGDLVAKGSTGQQEQSQLRRSPGRRCTHLARESLTAAAAAGGRRISDRANPEGVIMHRSAPSLAHGRTAVPNIDTDQIIPARFLTTTTKEGLGRQAFADWRYDCERRAEARLRAQTDGAPRLRDSRGRAQFRLRLSRASTRRGHCCFGFRAVVSTEIADIFRSNSLKTAAADRRRRAAHAWLLEHPACR